MQAQVTLIQNYWKLNGWRLFQPFDAEIGNGRSIQKEVLSDNKTSEGKFGNPLDWIAESKDIKDNSVNCRDAQSLSGPSSSLGQRPSRLCCCWPCWEQFAWAKGVSWAQVLLDGTNIHKKTWIQSKHIKHIFGPKYIYFREDFWMFVYNWDVNEERNKVPNALICWNSEQLGNKISRA